METTMQNSNYIFLQVMCELKIAQLKRANTLSTNPSIGGEGRVCTIAKNDEIFHEIPRFARVQSNSLKKGVANPWFIGPW